MHFKWNAAWIMDKMIEITKNEHGDPSSDKLIVYTALGIFYGRFPCVDENGKIIGKNADLLNTMIEIENRSLDEYSQEITGEKGSIYLIDAYFFASGVVPDNIASLKPSLPFIRLFCDQIIGISLGTFGTSH